MKCLDKKRIKLKQGEALSLNERKMLQMVSSFLFSSFVLRLLIVIEGLFIFAFKFTMCSLANANRMSTTIKSSRKYDLYGPKTASFAFRARCLTNWANWSRRQADWEDQTVYSAVCCVISQFNYFIVLLTFYFIYIYMCMFILVLDEREVTVMNSRVTDTTLAVTW